MKPYAPWYSKCLFLLFLWSGFAACRRNSILPVFPPSNLGTEIIYVLGSSGDSSIYWKNGSRTVLSSDPATYASSMAVVLNDVYVSGGHFSSDTTNSVEYWKNGIAAVLPDSTGYADANAIFVTGNDVYVGGWMQYHEKSLIPYTTPTASYAKWGNLATYWKNGQPVSLQPSNSFLGVYQGNGTSSIRDYINGMYVSGSDVYLIGGSNEWEPGYPTTYNFAGYWKNGVFTNLSNGLVDSSSTTSGITTYPTATSIWVSGNDVYATGNRETTTSQAIYWKNGVPVLLTNSPQSSLAFSLFVNGNDVYVAGAIGNANAINPGDHATYWKNGMAVTADSSSNPSVAYSVFVLGKDIYLAGSQAFNGVQYPTYWKNGVATHLGKNGNAIAIVVQ